MAFIRRELSALGGYRIAFVIRLLGLGLAVGSMVFLSRFVGAAANPHLAGYGGNYLGFMVLGVLAAEFQQVGVSGLAQRIRMSQMMGTLEAELATPAPPWMVLGAPPMYEFGAAALRSAAYLVAATLLLGLDLSRANWLSVALAVPLVIAAFSGLGLLAAGTTMLVRRLNPVAMIIGSLSFFLSGVLYPVTVLPGWLRAIGRPASAHARAGGAARRAAGRRRPGRAGRFLRRAAHLRGRAGARRASACSPSRSGARASTARCRTTEPDGAANRPRADLGVPTGSPSFSKKMAATRARVHGCVRQRRRGDDGRAAPVRRSGRRPQRAHPRGRRGRARPGGGRARRAAVRPRRWHAGPRFVDGHGHFTQVASELDWVDLAPPPAGARSSIEGHDRGAARAAATGWPPQHKYVLGVGYDDAMLDERRHPTKEDLDRVSTELPIWVVHASRHMAVGNSVALDQAGIAAATPDPEGAPGGRGIVRRPGSREPTGLLQERPGRTSG